MDKGTYRLEGLSRIFNATQLKPVVQQDPMMSAQSSSAGVPHLATLPVREKAVAGSGLAEPDNNDLVDVDKSMESCRHSFNPPNIHWQRSVCGGSGGHLVFKKKSGPTGCVLKASFSTFTRATRIRKVRGDGNCFFSVASRIL